MKYIKILFFVSIAFLFSCKNDSILDKKFNRETLEADTPAILAASNDEQRQMLFMMITTYMLTGENPDKTYREIIEEGRKNMRFQDELTQKSFEDAKNSK